MNKKIVFFVVIFAIITIIVFSSLDKFFDERMQKTYKLNKDFCKGKIIDYSYIYGTQKIGACLIGNQLKNYFCEENGCIWVNKP